MPNLNPLFFLSSSPCDSGLTHTAWMFTEMSNGEKDASRRGDKQYMKLSWRFIQYSGSAVTATTLPAIVPIILWRT